MQKRKYNSARTAKAASSSFVTKVANGTDTFDVKNLVPEIIGCRPENIPSGAYDFKWDYLNREILSKYRDNGGDSSSRVRGAIDKMLRSEKSCAEINQHGFRSFWRYESVLARAKRLIDDCIGSRTDIISSIHDHIAFTSGATVCRRRKFGDPFYKFNVCQPLSVTLSAYPLAKLIIDSTPLWRGQAIKTCRGNSVFTVPKETDIDRAACKEPALNQLIQTSIGNHIRGRLKRLYNIDLNDQSCNRRLAREGSITGTLATIDLKSASDSISCRLVDELLPPEISALLNVIRSPYGKLPNGCWIRWEKHSTMGNGYTFELQSLIFYALTRAACETIELYSRSPRTLKLNQLSVYGDDIICPSRYFPYVRDVLDGFGFQVNYKKSFYTGSFRESCGGHYFNGHDVKPFYIRKPIDSPERVIWLLNSLRKWAADDDGMCDPSVYPLWRKLSKKFVPSSFIGGRNLNSISELVSPEKPRFSLVWVTPRKVIDGPRALLRWFQYNPVKGGPGPIRIRHVSDRYVDFNSFTGYNTPYSVDFNSIMDVGAEEELRIKRYTPSLIFEAYWPCELEYCGWT